MASMMICLFFFGMLHAEHAAADWQDHQDWQNHQRADEHEEMKTGKVMSKFMPGSLPVAHGIAGARSPSIAQSDLSMQSAMLKTLGDMEARSQDMKAEYQRLRARIQKLPQADSEASFGSAASFGWLAAVVASAGLAASLGVAAVRRSRVAAPVMSMSAELSASNAVAHSRTSTPTMITIPRASAMRTSTAIQSGDIGTTKPLCVYDPLGLMTTNPQKYRRFQEMEIKHGRFAMAACLHVFVTEAGFRWPGYLSFAEDIKFSDMPGGTIASWQALPTLSWVQIVLIVALLDNSVLAQDPKKAPGDVAPPGWVRYEDIPGKDGREWKLNAERNNGRAAMMGITGMLFHENITGNPLWPIEVGPQPVLEIVGDDIEKGPARVGSFVLVSLGMAFAGILGAIPELGKDSAVRA
jgi:light-harvesting complex I chlorophyll a/b binding protein 1